MSDLDRLARAVGVEPDYETLTGDIHHVPAAALRAVLLAMGVPADTDAEVASAVAAMPRVESGAMAPPPAIACFMPDWLRQGRAWGVTCQVYSLRSRRNAGMGDFEDLARFAEIAAAAGADFVGVNPLHALFLAAPERCSPFFPSSRQFLSPLYIAVDRVPGAERLGEALDPPAALRDPELIAYAAVAAWKTKALERLFAIFQADAENEQAEAFERFVAESGAPLYRHALFETLSEAMVEEGQAATWHGWPPEYRDPASDAVRAFAEKHGERIAFHSWLQFVADSQLAVAQARARAAGMRIGLYLDLAVGVAPDGSATWSEPVLVVPTARIGAPPDYYNAAGQDWGLAPLSPTVLAARDMAPFRTAIDTVLRHSGALRIDHAMSLYRLFWIPEGFGAADGVYVRYPFHAMLRTLAEVSQADRSIVIGEDLGVVPPGFRDVMKAMDILSYRVFFFEKRDDWFIAPEHYPAEALACVTTHDSHTLAGWWSGNDIDGRAEIGLIAATDLADIRAARAHERRRVLGLLDERGLLPAGLAPVMRAEKPAPAALPEALAVAIYRAVARSPARLLSVPAEDLTGALGQVNVPGTLDEHPNWRRKLAVDLDAITDAPLFRALTAAMRQERPREE